MVPDQVCNSEVIDVCSLILHNPLCQYVSSRRVESKCALYIVALIGLYMYYSHGLAVCMPLRPLCTYQ
jgi:hypothetical protein